jgi:hypothetical protein
MELCWRKLHQPKSPFDLMTNVKNELSNGTTQILVGDGRPTLTQSLSDDQSKVAAPTISTEAFLVANWLVGEGEA